MRWAGGEVGNGDCASFAWCVCNQNRENGKKGMGKWQEKGEGTGTVEILGQNMR